MKTVLNVSGVNKQFGGLKALNEVHLKVLEGETLAIIGPNGAGKSTLLNVCIGRIPPDTGVVEYRGEIITGKAPYEINQAGIARVFQTPEIFPELSLLDNVMIPAISKRDGGFNFNIKTRLNDDAVIQAEATRVLKDFNLQNMRNDIAGSLSRGDKRRLELAMCLVQHPKLLLLDEPTAGMSRHDTNKTIDLLKRINEGGMTKVIIEHDMQVVFSLADRIAVLAQGTVIAIGTPDEVRNNPKVQEAYLGEEHE